MLRIRSRLPAAVLLSGAFAVGPIQAQEPVGSRQPGRSSGPGAGLLVMAHGGSSAWNAAVADAVAPLRSRLPTALAFGMADPATLQAALDSLDALGVRRVAVVRLFMSGASFLHQTEYLLGLRSDPPADPLLHSHGAAPGHTGHGNGHGIRLAPLAHRMEIALSREGLGESPLVAEILADRALGMSRRPSGERVMIVAHGMGEESENDDVLALMRRAARSLEPAGFSAVEVATLREDWPEARARAENAIRAWVAEGARTGGRTLVVPFRLSGFGPYAEVLEGLEYEPAEGLLPHPGVTGWIEEQVGRLLCPAGGPCPGWPGEA